MVDAKLGSVTQLGHKDDAKPILLGISGIQ